jgi:hypothetical protein
MTRCPACQCNGLELLEERAACVFCSFVAKDNVPSTVERLFSNTTPESERESGLRESGNIAAAVRRAQEWGLGR